MVECRHRYTTLRCGAPAVEVITTVCVHEHIHVIPFCQEHADEMNDDYDNDRFICCADCMDDPHGEDHQCKVRRIDRQPVDQREMA